MSNEFISVYDAMPPLNRLCECVVSWGVTKGRLIQNAKTCVIDWLRMKDGVFIRMPTVSKWRLIETEEETANWLRQSSGNSSIVAY